MLLTEKILNLILNNLRISIPAEMKKDLLAEYGQCAMDDEGQLHEYTEQDIYEQLRKKLRP